MKSRDTNDEKAGTCELETMWKLEAGDRGMAFICIDIAWRGKIPLSSRGRDVHHVLTHKAANRAVTNLDATFQ